MISEEKYHQLLREVREISANVRRGICPRCHEETIVIDRDGVVYCRGCQKIVWRFAPGREK
jgi:ribosomal protein L37AE/L43A